MDSNIESFKCRNFDANGDLGGGIVGRKDVLEFRWFLVFEEDEDLEYRMNRYEEISQSKAKVSSRFLSRSFDVVLIMSFV